MTLSVNSPPPETKHPNAKLINDGNPIPSKSRYRIADPTMVESAKVMYWIGITTRDSKRWTVGDYFN